MKKIAALLLALTFTAAAAACADTGGGTMTEELDPAPPESHFGFVTTLDKITGGRDPFIYVSEKHQVYYLVFTAKTNALSEDGLGFIMYKSKDLEKWAGPFSAFRSDTLDEPQQDFWAPEIHKIGDYYYLFGTFMPQGSARMTQILRTDNIQEEFIPWGLATPDDVGCLDATPFYEDGKWYSVYCEEWTTAPGNDGLMRVAELNEDFTNIKRDTIRTLFKASDTALNDNDWLVTDAPEFFRNRYGELFMLWSTFSNGKYCSTYAVSDNGKLSGNWIQSNEYLYKDDGGHAMIFKDLNGNNKIIFHTPNVSPDEHFEIHDIDDSRRGVLKII